MTTSKLLNGFNSHTSFKVCCASPGCGGGHIFLHGCMYVGGNGGDVLTAAATVADLGAPHESAEHSAQAEAREGKKKITVNNFLMLLQRNKEGG